MSRYQVKFQRNGQTIYGIYRDPRRYRDPKELAVKKRGNVIVEDAVLPKVYEVNESELTDLVFSFENRPEKMGEYQRHVLEQERLAEEEEAWLPEAGLHPGNMFSIVVGDGHATYVVTKVHRKNCDVEWRGFGMDRYYDHHFGNGGRFPKKEIARYVNMQRATQELFAKTS